VLEEGVATHRDIDFGMMAGAGLDPRRGLLPPFMRADTEGLDTVLERLENAQERHGERFAPPTILRRLVAQGRLGTKSGQGFYAYPQPDAEQPAEVVKLETRGNVAIAWLANGQMNSVAPSVVKDLGAVYHAARDAGARAFVIASSNPFLFSAGADIKAFTQMDASGGEQLLHEMHALLRELETGGVPVVWHGAAMVACVARSSGQGRAAARSARTRRSTQPRHQWGRSGRAPSRVWPSPRTRGRYCASTCACAETTAQLRPARDQDGPG